MKKIFSIGEVSKIKEITIKALRYYHEMEILIPRHIEESTGYRYYSIDQFIHIDIIKGCRELGTSIKELQDIFKSCDTEKLLAFLQFKKLETENNIIKMKNIIKNIDSLSLGVNHSKSILENDEISIELLEERYVIIAPCKEMGNLKELIYYSQLERSIKDREIETTIESGVIYNLDLEGNIVSRYVFNGIEYVKGIENEKDIRILPRGKYLTIGYTQEKEEERMEKVKKYIHDNNIKIKSFLEVDLLNDFFNTKSYSCQIQLLIENKRDAGTCQLKSTTGTEV